MLTDESNGRSLATRQGHDGPADSPATEGQTDPVREGLIENYRTILNELSLLTTVSVLLFGFLLASADSFTSTILEEVLYSVALVLVATATLVFVLPVVYHHLQFPFRNFEKFQERTHSWIMLGMPLLGGAFYLSLSLAIWSLLDAWALVISALPGIGTTLAFIRRKTFSDGTR